MSLDKFITELHDQHCVFQIPENEVKEIEGFVAQIIREFIPQTVKALGCNQQTFSVLEIIGAGSYFEQTKIKLPNEFDFMVVFKELSTPEAVKISQGCMPGYANVKITDQGKWYRSDTLFTPEREFETTILGFNSYIRQAVSLVPVFNGRFGKLTFQNVEVRGKPYSVFSHVQTANFTWKRHLKEDVLYLRNKVVERVVDKNEEFRICVDMMTCIHVPLLLLKDILPTSSMSDLALIKNGCHIVLKPCNSKECTEYETQCRLISYTKSEVEKMRNLDENWKVIYRCAKVIFTYLDFIGIDSYKLKTTILNLASYYGHVELGRGFILLLKFLYTSASTKKLNCHFNRSLNVWSISPSYRYFAKWQILLLLKIFERLQSDGDQEDFAKTALNILNVWISQSCRQSVEISQARRSIFDEYSQASFNVQGNTFLEIVYGMEPELKKHDRLKWIPVQMKIHVLIDVFKFLASRLINRIRAIIIRRE